MSPQSQTQSQLPRAAGNRWRLQIVHRTRFSYSGPVRSSYNEARLTPEKASLNSVTAPGAGTGS